MTEPINEPERKGFRVVRLLTNAEAQALPPSAHVPKGTGRIVEAECLYTGTLTYHLAIAWRVGAATHKHCCKVIKPRNRVSSTPSNDVEVSLYGITEGQRGKLVTHFGTHGTLKGLWHKSPPTTEAVRLDIKLSQTGEVFTANLAPAQTALIRWWMNLERNPTVWSEPPGLDSTQAPTQAAIPPKILPFSLLGYFGVKAYVDISTSPPTPVSHELRAWLLLRMHEHSYAMSEKVAVPENLGDPDAQDYQGQATHAIREAGWPAPANPKPQGHILRYCRPVRHLTPVTDYKGEAAVLLTDAEGSFEVLRRPPATALLPVNRHDRTEDWVLSDLEDVPISIPEAWENLPLA